MTVQSSKFVLIRSTSHEKVHNYFGYLLAYSYLCNRQESINKPNRRKIGANAFLRNAEDAHKQKDTQRNRMSDSGSEGLGFESQRDHEILKGFKEKS